MPQEESKYTLLKSCMNCAKAWGVPQSRLRPCTIELYRNWLKRGSVGALEIIGKYGETWEEFMVRTALGERHD
jgi:hypothetical protein